MSSYFNRSGAVYLTADNRRIAPGQTFEATASEDKAIDKDVLAEYLDKLSAADAKAAVEDPDVEVIPAKPEAEAAPSV